ncbi:MAG: hypothetical protein L3K06_08425, partial [Thermoplasmata archaeon]|nr:hypothetical protein [Thermoplasmata archaeon]
GFALAQLPETALAERELLTRLQHELYVVQSELATPAGARPPAHRLEERHVTRLEAELDRYTATLEPRETFVLSRGRSGGAALHVARTVARRAERELWSLHRAEPQRSELLRWTNRLSDLLFALALSVNRAQGEREIAPDYTV